MMRIQDLVRATTRLKSEAKQHYFGKMSIVKQYLRQIFPHLTQTNFTVLDDYQITKKFSELRKIMVAKWKSVASLLKEIRKSVKFEMKKLNPYSTATVDIAVSSDFGRLLSQEYLHVDCINQSVDSIMSSCRLTVVEDVLLHDSQMQTSQFYSTFKQLQEWGSHKGSNDVSHLAALQICLQFIDLVYSELRIRNHKTMQVYDECWEPVLKTLYIRLLRSDDIKAHAQNMADEVNLILLSLEEDEEDKKEQNIIGEDDVVRTVHVEVNTVEDLITMAPCTKRVLVDFDPHQSVASFITENLFKLAPFSPILQQELSTNAQHYKAFLVGYGEMDGYLDMNQFRLDPHHSIIRLIEIEQPSHHRMKREGSSSTLEIE